MSPRAGVRIAIVGIFAVLATVFVVSDARSQPRPGGISGVPRPPTFPQPPKFPSPPTFTPPNFPSPPTIPSMPNIPRGPQFETVWSCGKCKAELGRGNTKPSFDSCPRCGVRFVNGGGGGGGGFGLISPPPPDPGTPPANTPTDPDLLPRGNGGTEHPSFTAPPPTSSSDTAAKAPATEEKPVSKTGSLILKIMIGVFGFLFLLGMAGGAFLIIQANKGSKPAKKAHRKVFDDDEDDE